MVRSWVRQALRASGVAILVPAAIAAALALSVVGGGGDLGSLREVLRGPAVPPAEAAPPPPRVRPRGQTPRSHVRLRGQTPRSRVRPGAQSPQSRAPQRRVSRPPVRRPPSVTKPQPPAPAPPASSPPSPPPPPAPPAPKPHPIHDVGTQVADTVRPLPLAGPAAADAVQAVVNLVDPA